MGPCLPMCAVVRLWISVQQKMLPSRVWHGRQRIDGSQLRGVRGLFQLSSCRISKPHNHQYLQVMKQIFLPSTLFCKDAIVTKIMISGWTLIYIYPLLPTKRRVSDPMKFGSSKRTLARFLQWMMGYRDIFAQVKVDESSSKLGKHLKPIHENLWNQSHNLVKGCFFFWWIWNALLFGTRDSEHENSKTSFHKCPVHVCEA